MTPDERRKAIANAVAVASNNALAPTWAKVGLAAMAEELRELDGRIREMEQRLNGTPFKHHGV